MNMKNIKTKIILSTVILLSVVGFVGTVNAAGNFLYTSPSLLTVNAGTNITTSVIAGTSGDKICAVQGTVVFNDLICQSITVASGVMAITVPTCSSPNFAIGLPGCVITNTTLFTVLSATGNVGAASISFSDVKLAGVGVSAGTASVASSYTVNALPVVTPQPKPVETPRTNTDPTPLNVITPATKIPLRMEDTLATTSTPDKEINQQESLDQTTLAESQTASIGDSSTGSTSIWIIIIVLALVAGYFIVNKVYKKKK